MEKFIKTDLEANIDQLLNVRQVAEATAISIASVWRLSKSGDLPKPINIGRSVRWRASDLKKHFDAVE